MGFFKSMPTILLEDYLVGNKGDDTLLNIDGNKTGFFAWFLDKLSIKSRKITFTVHKNYVSDITGGKDFNFLPTRDIHSYNVGYSNKKILLILSILSALVAVVLSYATIEDGSPGFGFFLFILGGALSYLFFWLFKRSGAIQIYFSCQNSLFKGVRIKSGISGKQISKDDLHKLNTSLTSCFEENSKWFNNHFKK
tara:strand:- start:242 stop:826 length:585 start_codon:yes stop_codon:yes gene_type:complete